MHREGSNSCLWHCLAIFNCSFTYERKQAINMHPPFNNNKEATPAEGAFRADSYCLGHPAQNHVYLSTTRTLTGLFKFAGRSRHSISTYTLTTTFAGRSMNNL